MPINDTTMKPFFKQKKKKQTKNKKNKNNNKKKQKQKQQQNIQYPFTMLYPQQEAESKYA